MKIMNYFSFVIFAVFLFTNINAINIGDEAPNFVLYDQNGFPHSLREHRGQFVLLFFYGRDFTPFGIRDVKFFERMYQPLKQKNVVIYGISNDFLKTHQLFHEKSKLTYDLLSDPDKEVIGLYGANGWFETKSISVLISPDGKLINKYCDGDVKNYPLLALKNLD